MIWPLVEIGDYTEAVSTWNPRRSSSKELFRYIDLSSVDKDTKEIKENSVVEITVSEAPSRARQLVKSGDVIVSTVRPNLNGVARVPDYLDGATASTGYCVLRCDEKNLHSVYLYYWTLTESFVTDMVAKATGANYPAVSDKIIKESKIPLPPLTDQLRIAAILEKAHFIRRKRERALRLAEEFLRSLFLDMFGDPVINPKGWAATSVDSVSHRVTKGESPKWQGYGYGDEGVRFITSENVLWGKLDDRKKYVPLAFHRKLKRSQVQEGDILINLVGASVGRACIAKTGGESANVNQAVSVTTLKTDRILPEFALAQLLCASIQQNLLGNVVDAARANISLTNIREIEVIVPPLPEQNRYVEIQRKVEAFLEKNDLSTTSPLFDSLSHRAFAGDL